MTLSLDFFESKQAGSGFFEFGTQESHSLTAARHDDATQMIPQHEAPPIEPFT